MPTNPKYVEVSSAKQVTGGSSARIILLAALCGIVSLLFGQSLTSLVLLSLHDERYSHLITVPFVTGGLIFLRRRHIFADCRYWPSGGLGLAALGLVTYMLSRRLPAPADSDWSRSLEALAVVLTWIAAFAGCLGVRSLKAATFPLGFLFLFVPLPSPVINLAEGA